MKKIKRFIDGVVDNHVCKKIKDTRYRYRHEFINRKDFINYNLSRHRSEFTFDGFYIVQLGYNDKPVALFEDPSVAQAALGCNLDALLFTILNDEYSDWGIIRKDQGGPIFWDFIGLTVNAPSKQALLVIDTNQRAHFYSPKDNGRIITSIVEEIHTHSELGASIPISSQGKLCRLVNVSSETPLLRCAGLNEPDKFEIQYHPGEKSTTVASSKPEDIHAGLVTLGISSSIAKCSYTKEVRYTLLLTGQYTFEDVYTVCRKT